MKAWTQPICRTCYAAFLLGKGEDPRREPVRLADIAPPEPCLLCGEPTRIFLRIDPRLTAGLTNALEDKE